MIYIIGFYYALIGMLKRPHHSRQDPGHNLQAGRVIVGRQLRGHREC